MDGTNYGFNIQEEDEFDLLGIEDTPLPTKATTYTPAAPEAPAPAPGAPAPDTTDESPEDIDLLADPEGQQPEGTEGSLADAETPDTEAPSVDTYQLLAEDLVKMGVFAPDDEDGSIAVKTPEELAQRFQASYQKGAVDHINSIVGQYGPEYAEAWELIFEKGLNPYEYFSRQAQIDSFESMDLENESVQKHIVKSYYLKQGLSPERAEAKVQKAVDLDDIADDAKEYHELLLNAERQELGLKAQAAEQQRLAEERRRYEFGQSVHNVLSEKVKDKEYDGIPLTVADRDKAVDFLYTAKWKLPNGQVLTDAERWWMEMRDNPALAAKFALMAANNFDTTRIQKKGVSKENTKLFANLTQQNKVVQRQAPTQTPSSNFFDD